MLSNLLHPTKFRPVVKMTVVSIWFSWTGNHLPRIMVIKDISVSERSLALFQTPYLPKNLAMARIHTSWSQENPNLGGDRFFIEAAGPLADSIPISPAIQTKDSKRASCCNYGIGRFHGDKCSNKSSHGAPLLRLTTSFPSVMKSTAPCTAAAALLDKPMKQFLHLVQ
jgi:hypothetical protein